MRLRVAEQWDQFARSVLPERCDPIQRQEMRRAFYAGCQGMMNCILGDLSAGDDVTPADEQVMKEIHLEIVGFAAMVKAGRA